MDGGDAEICNARNSQFYQFPYRIFGLAGYTRLPFVINFGGMETHHGDDAAYKQIPFRVSQQGSGGPVAQQPEFGMVVNEVTAQRLHQSVKQVGGVCWLCKFV